MQLILWVQLWKHKSYCLFLYLRAWEFLTIIGTSLSLYSKNALYLSRIILNVWHCCDILWVFWEHLYRSTKKDKKRGIQITRERIYMNKKIQSWHSYQIKGVQQYEYIQVLRWKMFWGSYTTFMLLLIYSVNVHCK